MIFITFLQTSRSYTKDLIRFVFAWLDYAVYQFVSILMQAIFDIANFTLSEGIFEKLINRVYLILGIFMLFKITISLLTYLVNPDKISDKENGIGKLSVRVVLVLIMLIMLPSGFQILNDVQSALLPSIPRLILDSNSIDSTNGNISRTGKNIAASIWGAFYTDNADCIGSEPDGMTVYWNKGVEATEDQIKSIDMLKYYRDNVNLVCQVNSSSTAYQYEYTPLISTIVGGFMCYVLIGICITVAIRMFKMMILRMIAPIPIISYVDPKSSKDGAFSKWVKTLTSTWIELFINLGILYLIVFLVDSLLLNTTSELWNATQGFGFVRKSFFIVFVIMGLFAFARQAPKFIMDALGIKNQGNFMRAMGLSSVALGALGAGIGATRASWQEGGLNKLKAVPRGLFNAFGSIGAGGSALLSSDKPTLSTGYDAQQKYNATTLSRIHSGSTLGGRMSTRMQTLFLGQSDYDRMTKEKTNYEDANKKLLAYKNTLEKKALEKTNLFIDLDDQHKGINYLEFMSHTEGAKNGNAQSLQWFIDHGWSKQVQDGTKREWDSASHSYVDRPVYKNVAAWQDAQLSLDKIKDKQTQEHGKHLVEAVERYEKDGDNSVFTDFGTEYNDYRLAYDATKDVGISVDFSTYAIAGADASNGDTVGIKQGLGETNKRVTGIVTDPKYKAAEANVTATKNRK